MSNFCLKKVVAVINKLPEFLKQYLTEKQNSHFKEVTYTGPLLTRSGHYKRVDYIHIHNL